MAHCEAGMATNPVDPDVSMRNSGTSAMDEVTANTPATEDIDMNAEGEDGDEEGEEDNPFLKFQNVISAINFEQLRKHAVAVRLQQPRPDNSDPTTLSCEVREPPPCGSFNLVYILKFSDDFRVFSK